MPGFPKTSLGVGTWEAAGWRGWSPKRAGVSTGTGGWGQHEEGAFDSQSPALTHSSLVACFAPLHLFQLLPGHVVMVRKRLGNGRMGR